MWQDHDAEDDQPPGRAYVGTILVAGRDVTSIQPHELRRGIGYVIQQIGLFPHKTIVDNIGTVPRLSVGTRTESTNGSKSSSSWSTWIPRCGIVTQPSSPVVSASEPA